MESLSSPDLLKDKDTLPSPEVLTSGGKKASSPLLVWPSLWGTPQEHAAPSANLHASLPSQASMGCPTVAGECRQRNWTC